MLLANPKRPLAISLVSILEPLPRIPFGRRSLQTSNLPQRPAIPFGQNAFVEPTGTTTKRSHFTTPTNKGPRASMSLMMWGLLAEHPNPLTPAMLNAVPNHSVVLKAMAKPHPCAALRSTQPMETKFALQD